MTDRVIALFVLAVACTDSSARTKPVVLQVATATGIGKLIPPHLTGGGSSAIYLVLDPLEDHARLVERKGPVVVIERLPASPHDAAGLASALRFTEMTSARAVTAERIEVSFRDEPSAALFAAQKLPVVDSGPFRLVEATADRAVLVPRGTSALDRIELVATDADAQWRLLMARDVDVLPHADALFLPRLEGIDSIRTVQIPYEGAVGLYFNTLRPDLADPAVRRGIAAKLDRAAIAAISCADPGCANTAWSPAPVSPPPTLPSRLKLVVLESDYPLDLAGRTIRHQLRAAGIAVEIEPMSLDELVAAAGERGDFDLALLPIPRDPLKMAALFSGDGRPSVTGWSDPALDDALGRADRPKAQEILARAVPAIPLYDLRLFAAVDARFCGGEPQVISWRWLADLRPCEEEAGP